MVVPEPTPAMLHALARIREPDVVAPFAPPGWLLALRPNGPLSRRAVPRASAAEWPTASLAAELTAELALSAWASGHADRVLRASFLRRVWADRRAAPRITSDLSLVVAPTLGGRRSLARARALGVATALVMDLPALRRLHHDLDTASARWPESQFLRRFRAPAGWIAQQEAEWALADVVVVRSDLAARLVAPAAASVALLSPLTAVSPPTRPARHVFLAGGSAARHGTFEVEQLLALCPELRVGLRVTEGTEPRRLVSHPRVTVVPGTREPLLAGIDAVIALAWTEAEPRELALAARAGVPVVATPQASGPFVGHAHLDPGDVAALRGALSGHARAAPPPAWLPWQPET